MSSFEMQQLSIIYVIYVLPCIHLYLLSIFLCLVLIDIQGDHSCDYSCYPWIDTSIKIFFYLCTFIFIIRSLSKFDEKSQIMFISMIKKKMIDDQLITKIIEVTLHAESPCISCKKESKEELFLILADLRIYILIFQRIFLIPPGLSRLFRSFLCLSFSLSLSFSLFPLSLFVKVWFVFIFW